MNKDEQEKWLRIFLDKANGVKEKSTDKGQKVQSEVNVSYSVSQKNLRKNNIVTKIFLSLLLLLIYVVFFFIVNNHP